ncbi:putative ribonucleoside-diphosphate reductase small chain B [Earliella scabrosa]|nr:putative ribonucleoside-diphosphate reductase small chain B [Earliella scabrosa]
MARTTEILPVLTHSRFVLFPLEYPELWDAYKEAQASFWTADEINLTVDRSHWVTRLSSVERHFLSTILAFFVAADGIVVENLVQRFCAEVEAAEARCFYGFQLMIENVHSEVYSRLVLELMPDVAEQDKHIRALEENPVVKAKADWCLRWIEDKRKSFTLRLIAFAAVEGIFFSSSFAAIFWLRGRGLMPGLCHSNELISRDEGMHMRFACLLYRVIGGGVPRQDVYDLVSEAVQLEHQFFEAALTTPLLGMNASMMHDYVEYVADYLLQMLGYPQLFLKRNPFPFMENTSISARANFFERRVSDYVGARVSHAKTAGEVRD